MTTKKISIPGLSSAAAESLETIYPRNKSTSDSSDGQSMRNLTLGGALREFIANNVQAKHAQISAVAAGDSNISLAKSFCMFLQRLDFDAVVWVGVGFLKPFVKPCPQILEQIKEIGENKTKYNLSHAVVKINSVVIDLTFLRLGEAYEPNNSFSLKQFNTYFRESTSVAHLMAITPDQAKHMAKQVDSGFAVPQGMRRPGQRAFASSSSIKPVDWHVYTGAIPLRVRSSHGKTVTIKKGEFYCSYTKPNNNLMVTTASDPSVTLTLVPELAKKLMRTSRELQGAPAQAIRPPREIKISLSAVDLPPRKETWELE